MGNNKNKAFEGFLTSEYENIAQAHFKSIETISQFFRYYLLIMSIPLSAVALVAQQAFVSPNRSYIKSFFLNHNFFPFLILLLVSLIGVGIFCYIVNIRLDTVLYARTVNGIRKYYYDKFDEDPNLKLRYRQLPQSPLLPSYYEEWMFLPVVAVFGMINSFYFLIGSCFLRLDVFLTEMTFYYPDYSFFNLIGKIFNIVVSHPQIILPPVVMLILHFILYRLFTNHRESKYLKSNIIGIDIDGVLNKHRDHFCQLLEENAEKMLDPRDILIIPVHDDSRYDIKRIDESKVFNDPKYWVEMPVIENASDKIRNLKNVFAFKVYIFTWRSWPDAKDKNELKKLKKNFLKNCSQISSKDRLLKIIKISKMDPLSRITEEWLARHHFRYDKFFMEKGNDYTSDPRQKFNNRFWIARKKKIRFFVEDDLEKALKLSFICDIVFLISQPYNETSPKLPPSINNIRTNLPSNIIRVKDWTEINQQIRRLS